LGHWAIESLAIEDSNLSASVFNRPITRSLNRKIL
jgi:hypothetical protein